MQELTLVHSVNRTQQRGFAEVRPHVYQDGDSVTMQFRIGEIQSEMLVSDPNFLVLSYTRTMMTFLLFHESPERIVMIGLGGGSMPKWCYQQLPATDITVIEISPMVISLREQFYIPADSERFRVLCGDGADYVATTEGSPEVLLVDGFDIHGQSPQLCSREF
jgi:spermidine synthase